MTTSVVVTPTQLVAQREVAAAGAEVARLRLELDKINNEISQLIRGRRAFECNQFARRLSPFDGADEYNEKLNILYSARQQLAATFEQGLKTYGFWKFRLKEIENGY